MLHRMVSRVEHNNLQLCELVGSILSVQESLLQDNAGYIKIKVKF